VFAAANGYDIVRTYEDAGRSSVRTKGRDGLAQLLRDVLRDERDFSTILVLDVSRWGRFQDPDEAAHYEFICRNAGVSVRYCAEAFSDDGTPSAAIMKSLKRVMAAEYSRQLSDRCQVGKRRQLLLGHTQGGPAPYGAQRQAFNLDGSPGPILEAGEQRSRVGQTVRWVRGPESEIKRIRMIFDLHVRKDLGITEIAQRLNKAGLLYRQGHEWSYARVRHVLKNEIAKGVFVFNKWAGHFPLDAKLSSPSEWMRLRVFAPIVSPALFKAAQGKFVARQGQSHSDEEMLRRLARLLDQHGTLSQDLINHNPITKCSRSYAHRFGSLGAAYERVGFMGNKDRGKRLPADTYCIEKVTPRLRDLFELHGHLNITLVNACRTLPTAQTLGRMFGNIDKAYAAVGYNLNRAERQRAGWARRTEKRRKTGVL